MIELEQAQDIRVTVLDVLGREVAVLAEAAAVTDPVGAADVDGLVDRLRPVGLTGVSRAINIVVEDELKGGEVFFGRVVDL